MTLLIALAQALKSVTTAMNIVLMAVAIAILTFVLSASKQQEDNATRDAEGIDLVVVAKGSALQLILSLINHVDTPTGNIPRATHAQLAQDRLIKKMPLLALGDSDNGFRIIGTHADDIAHYQEIFAQGKSFDAAMQAVFGGQAASKSDAALGATFNGSHGLTRGGGAQKNAPYTVVGILPSTGTVFERLIQMPVAFEAAKLCRILGVCVNVLRGITVIVLLSAALSMLFALYNALEERKNDHAILPILGAPPSKLFCRLMVEGLFLSFGAAVLGWLAGHSAIEVLAPMLSEDQNFSTSGLIISSNEVWRFFTALYVGLMAALIPAIRAYRTDIVHPLA